MKTALIGACMVAALTGCATSPLESNSAYITPSVAVQLAAARPVAGVFDLRVRATGAAHEMTYLNSELDYRDQRNVCVALTPEAVHALQVRLGGNAIDGLNGKRILVSGVARRVTIYFLENGQRSDKYYYQTHIQVTDPAQITIAG